MYSYKLNNSYTIYVNPVYLNECIKASKNIKKAKLVSNNFYDIKKMTPEGVIFSVFRKNTN